MKSNNKRSPAAGAAPPQVAGSVQQRIAIFTVLLAGIAAAMHVGKAPVALAQMRIEFGNSLAALSWVMSVFPVIGVVGGVVTGVCVARVGDRRVLCVGMGIVAFASALGAYMHGFGFLIATRVLEGLGFLLVVVAAPAVLQRLSSPAQRPWIFGVWSTFMPCGMALSMVLGAQLSDWRSTWLVDAILSTFALFALLATVPAANAASNAGSKQPNLYDTIADVRTVVHSQPTWMLALTFSAYSLMYFAVLSFLPIFLAERMGISAGAAAGYTAMAVAANMIGNLSAGALFARGVRPSVSLAVCSLTVGLLGASAFFPGMAGAWVIAFCFVFSAVAGLMPATILLCAPSSVEKPSLVPLSIGLVMQGNYLGQLLGPFIVAAVVSYAGWSAAAWPVLVVACLGALLSARYGLASRARESAPRHG